MVCAANFAIFRVVCPGRFRGDTTIKGNDGIGIDNVNGGFVRSVQSGFSYLVFNVENPIISTAEIHYYRSVFSIPTLSRCRNARIYPNVLHWRDFVRFSTTAAFDDNGSRLDGFSGCDIENHGQSTMRCGYSDQFANREHAEPCTRLPHPLTSIGGAPIMARTRLQRYIFESLYGGLPSIPMAKPPVCDSSFQPFILTYGTPLATPTSSFDSTLFLRTRKYVKIYFVIACFLVSSSH